MTATIVAVRLQRPSDADTYYLWISADLVIVGLALLFEARAYADGSVQNGEECSTIFKTQCHFPAQLDAPLNSVIV